MPFVLADSLASDFGADRGAESDLQAVSCLSSEGSVGCGMGAIAPARPAGSLPCLFSNNSTERPSKLTPYQRKNAFSINENLVFCVERFGLGKIGFLTLTFPKDLTLKEAMRRFNSLATHILDKHFECWVRVVEFTKGGRPHIHLIVVCREEIREGFHFENYLKMARLSSNSVKRRKNAVEIRTLSRSLDPTSTLRAIWSDLRKCLPEYQFGRAELIPIRKSGAALARYVGGYIRKSIDFRPLEAKGARLVAYSKSFPRKVVGHAWGFHTPAKFIWRQKVARFAELHRVKDLTGMKSRFGPRWAWWFKDLIESLNILPGMSCEQARVYFDSGVDAARLDDSLCNGGTLTALHLYPFELPKLPGGDNLQPPRRLRSVFDFHFSSWNLTPDQISDRSASDRRRLAALRASGRVYFTAESLDAAKLRLVAVPIKTPAQVRSENYFRTRFPHLAHS